MGALKHLPEREKSSLRWLIGELFPATRGKSDADRFRQEKRVASEDYFDRYFSYSVAEKGVSDVELREFINQLNQADEVIESSLSETFIEIVEDSDVGTLLSKLSARINLHSEASSHALIILLSYASDRFPRQRDAFSVSPFQQGFFLIRDLLDKLDHDHRQQAVEDVIKVGYLPLAGRLVAALQSSEDSESPFPEMDPEPAFDHLSRPGKEHCTGESM
jgi:hypothetical protein